MKNNKLDGEQHQAKLNTLKDVYFELDVDLKILRANEAAALLCKSSSENLTGKNFGTACKAFPESIYKTGFKEVLETGLPLTLTHFYETLKLSFRWLSYFNGKHLCVLGINLSGQTGVQNTLNQAQQNQQVMLDNTNVGHLLLDKEYTVINFNQTMGTFYPLLSGRDLILNTNFIDCLTPERRPGLTAILNEVEKTKTPYIYNLTYPFNNETQYLISNVIPVIETDEVIGYTMSVYEITKLKLLEFEREKIIHDLIQRNRDVEQFSYIVSHNIRSPLATMLGLSSLLKGELDEKDKAIVLKGMEETAGRLDVAIKDVNEILNIKKDLSQAKSEISLIEVMTNVLNSLNENIKTSGAVIKHDFANDAVVYSISPYIHSIFYNLISNAIKYAKRQTKPEILIQLEKDEKFTHIYFKDNGIGIDMDKYGDQLFGLYKKFNYDIEGKGMGLFMVKSQVDALGGQIKAESVPDEGSVFKISLPV